MFEDSYDKLHDMVDTLDGKLDQILEDLEMLHASLNDIQNKLDDEMAGNWSDNE